MQTDDSGHIELSQMIRTVCGPDRNEMGHLGQHVHHDPYSIVSMRNVGKTGDEVHADIVPFPLRNGQRLK